MDLCNIFLFPLLRFWKINVGFKICFQAPDYFDEEEDKIVMSCLVCWLRMVITQSKGAHMQDITEVDYCLTHNEVGIVTCKCQTYNKLWNIQYSFCFSFSIMQKRII